MNYRFSSNEDNTWVIIKKTYLEKSKENKLQIVKGKTKIV